MLLRNATEGAYIHSNTHWALLSSDCLDLQAAGLQSQIKRDPLILRGRNLTFYLSFYHAYFFE